MYYVYVIIAGGKWRYVGITNNPKTREGQHRRGLKSGDTKELYQKFRSNGIEDIKLKVIKQLPNKVEAMRLEAYLILQDYFSDKNLWQSPPFSFRYF